MTIHIETGGFAILVKGNTYKYKEIIKHYGFRWNRVTKSWYRTFKGFGVLPALVADLRKAGATVVVAENLKNVVASDVKRSREYAKEDKEERVKAWREMYRQKRKYGE